MGVAKAVMRHLRWGLLLVIGLMIGMEIPAWAASRDHPQGVTTVVPTMLSLTASEPVSLGFPDTRQGTDSAVQEVTYAVRANNMAPGAFAGAVIAQVETLPDWLILEADVGNYTNQGTVGNAVLVETTAGFHPVGMAPTTLLDKAVGSGDQDAVLHGTLTITWKGTLTKDHSTAPLTYTPALTVTLKDGS